MPNRLPLLFALLLLSGLLFAAAGAHGAAAVTPASASSLEEEDEGFEIEVEEEEEGEAVSAEAECEIAREEVDAGEMGADEAEEICAEAEPAVKPKKGKSKNGAKRGAQRRKKTCRHRASSRKKQHCPRGTRKG